jgi:twitching motility protein PilT
MLRDPDHSPDIQSANSSHVSYAIERLARFRVNAFRHARLRLGRLRAIPSASARSTLQRPAGHGRAGPEERGIILVTGPRLGQVDDAGRERSTTSTRTVPATSSRSGTRFEFLHADKRSIINQREVGNGHRVLQAGPAPRAAPGTRRDPHREIARDEETVHTALSAAETGHLVFSTVHTIDATETINRLIDFFPPHMQPQDPGHAGGAR